MKISIQQKILLGTIFIIALGLSAIVMVSHYTTSRTIKHQILNHEVPLMAQNIEKEFNTTVSIPLKICQTVAKNQFAIDWIERGEPKEELDKVRTLYDEMRTQTGAFRGVLISDISKKGYGFEDNGNLVLMNIGRAAASSWYFDLKKSEKRNDIRVYPDSATFFSSTLYINVKMYNHEGRFVGVNSTGISLNNLISSIASQTIGDNGETFMVDRDGIIKIHKDNDLINSAKIQDMDEFSMLEGNISNLSQDMFSYDSTTGKEWLTVEYIPIMDWYLIIKAKESDFLSQVEKDLVRNIIFSIIILLIAIIIILRFVTTVVKPIRKLAYVSNEISKGNYSETVMVKGHDELAVLAGAFNKMTLKVQESINTLEERILERTTQLGQAKDAAEAATRQKVCFSPI